LLQPLGPRHMHVRLQRQVAQVRQLHQHLRRQLGHKLWTCSTTAGCCAACPTEVTAAQVRQLHLHLSYTHILYLLFMLSTLPWLTDRSSTCASGRPAPRGTFRAAYAKLPPQLQRLDKQPDK
jgi:hypothetical protein